jgi:glutathione synthase
MSLRVAVQMDAIERINPKSDSTLAMMRAAQGRGYQLFYYQPQDLVWNSQSKRLTAYGHPITVHDDNKNYYTCDERSNEDLSNYDVILLRQDPPFDLAYITTTHLLEHVQHKVLVVNDPAAVRNAPEKLLITKFSEFMPPTLIARDINAIRDFWEQHGEVVIKPLFSYGGRMVFHLRQGNDSLGSLIELFEQVDRAPWMVQKYLPNIVKGDKRILLVEGEAVGAVNRIPAAGDIRANLRAGGRAEKTELTEREKTIVAALAPTLRQQGLIFVGLDVIDNHLTEINVTSPTGLALGDQLYGWTGKARLGEKFWDAVVARRKTQ